MIKGLSDRRRLPRAGIIRLGIKKKHAQSGNEYPSETDFFVCPPLVQEVYGDKPKKMIVMFPVEDETMFFQQNYKRYGHGILLCRGDGETAVCWDFDKGGFREQKCPCEKLESGDCKPVGILQFLLPEIKESVGVWQISTSSKNSIIDINSGIDFVRGVAGRVAMIPLILKRDPLEIHRIEGNNIKKGKHFTLKLSLGMSLVEIQKLAQRSPAQALLPSPPDETQEAVEDLFPKDGFAPDEEKRKEEVTEPIPELEGETEKNIQRAKELLDELMKEYVTLGGKISFETAEKIQKFTSFKEYSAEIERLQAAIEKKKVNKAKANKSEKPKDLFEESQDV